MPEPDEALEQASGPAEETLTPPANCKHFGEETLTSLANCKRSGEETLTSPANCKHFDLRLRCLEAGTGAVFS